MKFLVGTLNDPLTIADTTDFGVIVNPDTTISYASWAAVSDSTRIPMRLTWINAGGNTDIVIRPSSLKDVCAATSSGDYLGFYQTNFADPTFAPVLYVTIADATPATTITSCYFGGARLKTHSAAGVNKIGNKKRGLGRLTP
jgi:hypothetical protein